MGTPSLAMNVGTPLMLVVPVSSIVTVGATFVTVTEAGTQVCVSSSVPQTLRVNVPSSP